MATIDDPNAIRHLHVVRGGSCRIAMAHDSTEMRQQLLVAVAISTLLGGDLVHIDGWLPGLTLRVQALQSLHQGEQMSIQHLWPNMYAQLIAWLDQPADADILDLSYAGAHCVLAPNVLTWQVTPPAFTIKCVVPSLYL